MAKKRTIDNPQVENTNTTETTTTNDVTADTQSQNTSQQVEVTTPEELLGQFGVPKEVVDAIQEAIFSSVVDQVLGRQETSHIDGGPEPIVGRHIGDFNFDAFEIGSQFEGVSANVLRASNLSRKNLCSIIEYMTSWFNAASVIAFETQTTNAQLHAEIKSLERKLKKANELLGIDTNDKFGKKSQRSTALDPERAKAKKKKKAAENADSEESSDSPEEKSAQSGEQPNEEGKAAEKEAATEDGKNAEEKKEEEKEDKKKRSYTPKRGNGCGAEASLENTIHVPVYKPLSDEDREKIANGTYKPLPDGKYAYVMFLSMPVTVIVTYQRAENLETGDIVAAASAKEDKMLPGSILSPSLLTHVQFLRIGMGVSVPRIMKQLNAAGFNIKKQNFYRWNIQYALALMRPLVTRMLQKILESGKAQADETWTRIREDLAKNGRQNSILWLLRTSEKLNIPPIVVVVYTGSRAAKEFADLIRGYAVKLMADGYSGYSALLEEFADSFELVGCLQHARSYFADVVKSLKGSKEYKKLSLEERDKLPVNKVLDLFGEVFKVDKEMDTTKSLEEQREYCETKTVKALDKLFEQIEKYQSTLKDTDSECWKKAVNYAMNHKDRFYAAARDPEMPIHNSACERTFASYGILRSNYKQIDTVLGAEALTLWFSALQTAKENGVNEQVYLAFLISELPEVLKEHGDYYWYSMAELKKGEKLNGYGDLKYLDEYMPTGKKFKAFEEKYQDELISTFVWISDMMQKAQMVPEAKAE